MGTFNEDFVQKILKFQLFTSGGTWTCPAADTQGYAIAIAAGGGGGALSGAGSQGGTSSFGAIASATGGLGGLQAGATYDKNPVPETGYFGFGSGGEGAPPSSANAFGGGGKRGNVTAANFTTSSNQTVTIGAGGAAGAAGAGENAEAGEAGAVLVYWWEAES